MNNMLDKKYNSNNVEGKIYDLWMKSGFFNPDNLPGKRTKPYSIVLPPPNVTGQLHMGHALNATMQDIIIRRKRMQGYLTLWLPGTDHAGIATQNVVEKKLKKEGKTRFDVGKEGLIEEIWEWKKKYGSIILNQFKRIGSSCDWSRTKFTMDDNYKTAVKQAFLNYQKKGLIYQGERVVNWCPRCQTSLSDMELAYKEEKIKLYHIKYPLKQGGFITVATTRPETMLGDKAIAVNPKDKRFKKLIGQKAILPIINEDIPIIKDLLVDLKFGTGALKVTPAHDMTDYEISLKHDLKLKQVIDENIKMTGDIPKKFLGLSIKEAREIVIKDLEKLKLIKKIEPYIHRTPYCDRCKTKTENLPSKQWFVKMKDLAQTAREQVKKGKIKFVPKRFEKPFFAWIDNIRDWCISRQIWWGHKIPIQEEVDVLDTWFSSALWPFATLGWPKQTKDLKKFYPTAVLSTAKDIINLWVLRMIFSGIFFMKKAPFSTVFIHPMVLATDGTKMSKSVGNVINPIDLIEKYGADATRLSLSWGVTGNQDMRFSEDNVIMGQKFCNKIWNATRFILMQAERESIEIKKIDFNVKDKNKKIIKQLKKIIESTDKNIDNFEFGKTIRALCDFFWHTFCDKYIEEAKDQIQKAKTKKEKERIIQTLLYVLVNSLKLLHPFIPFVTEEIYQNIEFKNKKQCLMIEDWPK